MSKKAVFKSVVIGCDHAAYDMKMKILEYMKKSYPSVKFLDIGPDSSNRVDYPDYAIKLCKEIQKGNFEGGILICGTGIGMSIAANKFEGIRCGVVHSEYTTEMTRKHNNANVLAFGARVVSLENAIKFTDIFLTTEFEGKHHVARINKFKLYKKGE